MPGCFLKTITKYLTYSKAGAKNFNLKKNPKYLKFGFTDGIKVEVYQRDLEDCNQTVKHTALGHMAMHVPIDFIQP